MEGLEAEEAEEERGWFNLWFTILAESSIDSKEVLKEGTG